MRPRNSRARHASAFAGGIERVREVQEEPKGGNVLLRLWLECLTQAARDKEFRKLRGPFWSGDRGVLTEQTKSTFNEIGRKPPAAAEADRDGDDRPGRRPHPAASRRPRRGAVGPLRAALRSSLRFAGGHRHELAPVPRGWFLKKRRPSSLAWAGGFESGALSMQRVRSRCPSPEDRAVPAGCGAWNTLGAGELTLAGTELPRGVRALRNNGILFNHESTAPRERLSSRAGSPDASVASSMAYQGLYHSATSRRGATGALPGITSRPCG